MQQSKNKTCQQSTIYVPWNVSRMFLHLIMQERELAKSLKKVFWRAELLSSLSYQLGNTLRLFIVRLSLYSIPPPPCTPSFFLISGSSNLESQEHSTSIIDFLCGFWAAVEHVHYYHCITLFENHSKCRIWIFEIWHFPPIFVLTCLVIQFDRKLQVIKNSPKWTILGIFN